MKPECSKTRTFESFKKHVEYMYYHRIINVMLMDPIQTIIKTRIIDPIGDIVEWDRYGVVGGQDGFIFGWIKREDGFRDFVVVNFKFIQNLVFISYNTSSKKSSKEIGEKLGCADVSYSACKPVTDIGIDFNIVKWQKEASVNQKNSSAN